MCPRRGARRGGLITSALLDLLHPLHMTLERLPTRICVLMGTSGYCCAITIVALTGSPVISFSSFSNCTVLCGRSFLLLEREHFDLPDTT